MKKLFKKSIKSMFLVLMLLIIALSFSACSQIRIMSLINEDGSIDEIVGITILPEEIESAGYDINELKNDILVKSQAQANSIKEDLNEKVLNDLLKVRDEESIKILNSFINGIDIIKSGWDGNNYVIGIKFENINIYKYYYNINESSDVEMKIEEHFLYNNVYHYGNTMFVKYHDLYDKFNAYYSVKYSKLIGSENNELLYTYKTDMRRQHSDADYITKYDGEYYHTWVVDPNNINEPIMLYYNVANPENWIILSVCITLLFTIILIIISLINNSINKKKRMIN